MIKSQPEVELSKRAITEQEILEFWQNKNIFRRHIEKNQSGPVFCFFEGPPTANGKPGIHHVLSRVFKDIYIRYYGLKGFHILRRAGWDCHGLPVEREVEKELGIETKAEIETKYGLEKFNELCRKSVLKYVDAWNQFTQRLGFWVDLDDPYFTMDNSYIESVWSLLKQINDKGLLYQGYKVVPFDPVMGATMSDAEVALGYKTVQDPSVTVKFKINDKKVGDLNGAEFLVWTTTPWTLPANVALAFNSNEDYVLFEAKSDSETNQFICAKPLYESVIGQKADEEIKFTILKSYKGSDLVNISYERLYDFIEVPTEKKGWYTLAADFVTMDSGTGIVHIAPAYGADDLQVGIEKDLPVIYGAGLDGKFHEGPFADLFFKDADKEVLKELKSRNKIWKSETYSHEYPHGWRTGAPLMYYAKDAWYIRTTQIRDQLIQNNQNIRWVPNHIKEGRFGNWLENNRDWALSRERYWGTPLPVWGDDEGNFEVIGSVAELESKVGRKLTDLDLHRPFIDEITYTNKKTGKTFQRTPEVIDCWFDSGSMPYSQWPLSDIVNRERFFPADFISEAVDQTRGWFYTLLAISTMISNQSSYKNVVCLGHVLDAKGEKMSKSKGNTVDPWHVFNVHGADAIRWYFLTGAPPGNSRRIGAPGSQGDPLPLVQGFFNMIHNSLEFYHLYANADKVKFTDLQEATKVEDRPEIDRWVLARLQKLIQDVSDGLTDYDCLKAGRQIEQFVDSLSNWYIRRNRRRFWKGERDADKLAAYDTLYQCLKTLSILMAPFTPFLAEDLFQKLKTNEDPESVHLSGWPKVDLSLLNETILAAGDSVMLVASLGRSARQRSGRKVRQPLSKVMVFTPAQARNAVKVNEAVLLDELNVKQLIFLEDAGSYFSYSVKPNLPVLGKKIGAKIKFLQQYLKTANLNDLVVQIKSGESFGISLDNQLYNFTEEDFLIEGLSKEGTSGSEANGFVVVIDTSLTDELVREGFARDLVRQIQELRKKAGFEITDRIELYLKPSVELAELAIHDFIDYIEQETLATRSEWIDKPDSTESFENSVEIAIKRKTR